MRNLAFNLDNSFEISLALREAINFSEKTEETKHSCTAHLRTIKNATQTMKRPLKFFV